MAIQDCTTAELGLALVKHTEGRVILPSKIREEIQREIKRRG